MNVFLFAVYLIFILYHLYMSLTGKTKWFGTFFTILFLLFLINGCDYKQIYDLSNYSAQYTQYDPLKNDNFALYYIFFYAIKIGQIMGLSFETWWSVMNCLAFGVMLFALYKHKYNPHLFMLFFMAYYIISYYTGIKAFYGFCIYLLASGYLLRGGLPNKIKYTVLTAVAGGFHVMYYVYLIFLLISTGKTDAEPSALSIKRKNRLLSIVIALSLVFSVILKISGSANSFFARLFSFFEMESEKIETYLELSTNWGFLIPVCIQLLCLLFAYNYRIVTSACESDLRRRGLILYYINFMQIIFYPFFMLSTTFMRFVTYFVPVSFCFAGVGFGRLSFADRKRVLFFGAIVILGNYFRSFVLGSMWEVSIIPLFTNRFI